MTPLPLHIQTKEPKQTRKKNTIPCSLRKEEKKRYCLISCCVLPEKKREKAAKQRAIDNMEDDSLSEVGVFAAEKITKKRTRNGRTEYLVKWKGELPSLATED